MFVKKQQNVILLSTLYNTHSGNHITILMMLCNVCWLMLSKTWRQIRAIHCCMLKPSSISLPLVRYRVQFKAIEIYTLYCIFGRDWIWKSITQTYIHITAHFSNSIQVYNLHCFGSLKWFNPFYLPGEFNTDSRKKMVVNQYLKFAKYHACM